MNSKKTLERYLAEMPDECFETLTFKDLEVGDKYIALPIPGDNDGHGGYTGIHYLFEKIEPLSRRGLNFNSKYCEDGKYRTMPDDLLVIKVE